MHIWNWGNEQCPVVSIHSDMELLILYSDLAPSVTIHRGSKVNSERLKCMNSQS